MRAFFQSALSAIRAHRKPVLPNAQRRGLRFEALEERRLLAVLTIAQENQLPGTPQSTWDVSPIMNDTIEGYTDNVSYNAGQAVNFKVDTDASSYRIDIYRMGYYGGDGARLVSSIANLHGTAQPNPLFDSTTGLIDAGNWSVTATWNVPVDATSGVYFADLIRTDGTAGANQAVFVVRNDASHSDMLFQASVSTWEAYNTWGGASLYTDLTGTLPAGRAYAVSYNRPYEGGLMVFDWEQPMIMFLEQNGYDASYTTDVDVDRNGSLLLNHEVFLSVGHDEYWSAQQRTNVEAARDAGVNLAFFSGNEVFWKVSYAASTDPSATPYRTMVCYKESLANALIDPDTADWTGTWQDPSFTPEADGGQPQNALTGTLFTSIYTGAPGTSLTVPYTDSKLRFWRNTDVAALAPGQSATLGDYVIGYEIDEDIDNGYRPAGLFDLSNTTISVPGKLDDQANGFVPGTAVHSMTLYRAASGALVFGAGTIQYSWALDAMHYGPATSPDVAIMQATVNLFADMGVQPATLETGLLAAAKSTDTTRPTSTVTSLANGSTVLVNGSVVITGSAQDFGGGVVAGVEISVDGGQTWHPVSGRQNWSYLWSPATQGGYYIMTRAIDDSGNIQISPAGISVTAVAASMQTSVWNTTFVPTVGSNPDHSAVEVGTKFTSTVAGYVTGLRFYKGEQNAGTHIGNLWSSSGTLLATVTFTSETASGGQTALFSNPVAIKANTTYVISYFAPLGNYAVSPSYFAGGAAVNGTLKATMGVYSYGASSLFPSNSYQSSNYWVDPIVATTSVVLSPATGLTGISTDAAITATFGVAMTAATINANTFELLDPTGAVVPAAVTYNATSRTATLTPASPLMSGMTYTAVIRGQTGGITTNSGTALGRDVISMFTTAATPAGPEEYLWAGNQKPAVVDSGDATAAELGMVFQTDVAGYVTGVRFYKSANNSGLHTGSLWTTDGTLLASINFTSETASGWQEANFQMPVYVQANTQYVISYYAPSGHYSQTVGGLASSYYENSITAVGSGTTPNGLYLATTDGFPTATGKSTNYWVSPVFVASMIASITPTNGDANFPANGAIDVAFSRDVNISTITTDTIQLFVSTRCGMGACTTCMCARAVLVSSSVSYDVTTNTAIVTPNVPLVASGSYTLVVRGRSGGVLDADGNALVTDVFSTFTATTPVTSQESVFPSTAAPKIADSGDASPVELGMKFTTGVDGYVTGVRFYKSDLNTGAHVGNLWSSTGQLLATVTFGGEAANGWQQANFSTPVAIQSNTTYIISYYAPAGHYSIDVGGLANTITSGDIIVPGGVGGVYSYGGSSFPTTTYQSSNYWVDPVFVASPIASILPANGAQLVPTSPSIQVTFNWAMNASTINGATIKLEDASGAIITATVSYNTQTNVATLTPLSSLAGGSTYTVLVSGGVTGVRDALGNGLLANITSVFTTAAPTGYSLWPNSALPAIVDSGETSSVQLGVKFRSNITGYVDGVRFYKSAANTGTHVGYLWSSSGTLLAQVTFANETASGWQQATFSAPVLIQSNTTYIVSYLAPNGHYSTSVSYFATTGAQSNMLTALASGVDGANSVFNYGATKTFPTGTYSSSNYWVDLVFSPMMVSSIQPQTGSSGVALNSATTVAFGTAMNASTINSSTVVLKTSVGVVVPATVTYNAVTQTATLTPNGLLAYSSQYMVTVVSGQSGVRDANGNALPADATSTFTSADPPRVSTVTPATGTTNVSTAAPMTIVFAQAMNSASITAGTVKLVDGNGNAVPGSVSYDASTLTATFAPSVLLANSVSYTLTVVGGTAGVLDASGNSLLANVATKFTTAAAPTVTSITPAASVTNVSTTSMISVVFAQAMDAKTISTSTIKLLDANANLVASTVSYNATTRTATLTPITPLTNSATYTVVVVSGAAGVRDSAENAMAADGRATFTTAAAPIVTSITPGAGATNVSLSTTMTVVFGQAMDATTITSSTIKLLDSSANPVLAAVSYNATTRTATLTPNSPLSTSTNYTVVAVSGASGVKDASGNVLPADARAAFTTTSAASSYSVWSGTTTPAIVDSGETLAVQLGAKFRTTVDGFVTGIKFYKSAANTGTHIGYLWSNTGTLLSQVTFTAESASGWQVATFATPVFIKANTTYLLSYLAPNGHYSINVSYFATSGAQSGPLTELASGVDGQNGVYLYGTKAGLPTGSYSSSNYWVDALFVPSLVSSISPSDTATNVSTSTGVTVKFGGAMNAATINSSTIVLRTASGVIVPATVSYDATSRTATLTPSSLLAYSTQYRVTIVSGAAGVKDANNNVLPADSNSTFNTVAPPTVSSITPANGATSVSVTTPVTVVFAQAMDATTITASTVQLLDANGAPVSSSVSYNATTRTATLTPNAALAGSGTYTVLVRSGATGARDTSGNALAADVRASFNTIGVATSYSTWNNAAAPQIIDSGDASAVQLGAKFRVTADGFITGVKFYKSAANTGTHIGYLWSSTGSLLAQVTFSGEAASGWQLATFSTPVLVNANTTYVVSYLAPKGHYSIDVSYFATSGAQNGPLTELASGVDGQNGVYLYGTKAGLPTGSYSSSNYWVDVVYVKSLVSSISPAGGATGASRSTIISITFGAAMNAASLNSSTIQLVDSTGKVVPANLVYDATTKTLSVTPTATLKASTSYTIRIKSGTSGVTDAFGNTLAADITSTFKTGKN